MQNKNLALHIVESNNVAANLFGALYSDWLAPLALGLYESLRRGSRNTQKQI